MQKKSFTPRARQKKLLVVSIVLFVLILIASKAALNMRHNAAETRETKQRVEAAVAELTTREKHLEGEVKRINTPHGLDEEIRERYGVKKPGEGVIILVDQEAEKDDAETSAELGSFERFLQFIGF